VNSEWQELPFAIWKILSINTPKGVEHKDMAAFPIACLKNPTGVRSLAVATDEEFAEALEKKAPIGCVTVEWVNEKEGYRYLLAPGELVDRVPGSDLHRCEYTSDPGDSGGCDIDERGKVMLMHVGSDRVKDKVAYGVRPKVPSRL
jgi:hypothetical protein